MVDLFTLGAEIFLLLLLITVFIMLLSLRHDFKQKKQEFAEEVSALEEHRDFLKNAGQRLMELKNALEREQEKSDRLLRNILPEEVIKNLQENGESPPERFESVAVFFADIVNFTGIVPNIDPEELVRELNDIFGTFDQIFAKYNCERIKTVGDAYMAVAGMHKKVENPTVNMLNAVLEARDALARRNARADTRSWLMRFGVNTGPVIGGIVGQDKYIYDIFGDTVNMASRIEHASEPMKINVSRRVFDEMKDKFYFEFRGNMPVKGRGEIEMYFLCGAIEQ